MQAGFSSNGVATMAMGKSKSALKKAGKRFLRWAGPPLSVFLICFIVVAHLIGPVLDIARACVQWVRTEWNAIFDLTESDDDFRVPWNTGQDVDKTAILYQIMLDEQARQRAAEAEEVDTVQLSQDYGGYYETLYEPRRLDSVADLDYEEFGERWYDMMRNEHLLLAPEDMLHIFGLCYEYNEHMFEMDQKWYEYQKWDTWTEVSTDEWGHQTGESDMAGWRYPVVATTNLVEDHDVLYNNLSYTHVKGEIDHAHSVATKRSDEGDMVRRFANHWQDTIAVATMFSYENYEEWGTLEDSEYVPSEKTFGINSANNYYLAKEDLTNIFNLFKYNFSFYYDPVVDDDLQYRYPGSMQSVTYYDNTMNVEGTVHEENSFESNFGIVSDTYYEFHKLENNEYDHVAYRFRMIPGVETRYAIDIAPRYIFNSFDSYTFVYTSTDNVPDYCPEEFEDPQKAPPKGMYLCGRWHTIDPYYFVEAMNVLCPWWKERFEAGARHSYNWVDEMIERLEYYIMLLPYTLVYERSEEIGRLADLYNEKQILLMYEGTRCEEMEEYVTQYEEWLKEHRPGWTLVVDRYSETEVAQFYGEKLASTEEFYEIDNHLEGMPFPTYGVTYNAETPGRMAATGGGSVSVDERHLRDRDSTLGEWGYGETIISLYESGFLTYEELMAMTQNPEYYETFARYVQIGSNTYFYEMQRNGSAWDTWGPRGVTVRDAGCFWYAMCSMISAKTGRAYTIENLVSNLNPDAYGGKVNVAMDGNKKFAGVHEDGSLVKGTGMLGGTSFAQQRINEAGLNWTAKGMSNYNINDVRKDMHENGSMYVYYYSFTKPNGKSGAHWVSLVNVEEDGSILALGTNNGSGHMKIKSWSDLQGNWNGSSILIKIDFNEGEEKDVEEREATTFM